MKITISIIVLLFSVASVSATDLTDTLYYKANQAYSNGEYELAYQEYSKILESGLESSDLYYNMGNAAFRSNQLGHSILYYEKALKLDPRNEAAEKNLSYVSNYKEDQLDSVPKFFIKAWVHKLFYLFSVKNWALFSIFLFSLMLIGVIVYIFASRLGMKKTGFYTSLFSLFLFFIAISGALKTHQQVIHPNNSIIISPSVVVKSSPSLSGTDLFILHEGTAVTIDDTVGEWIEIKLSDGRVGWIPVEMQEII